MTTCNITFQKKTGELISLTFDEAKELYNELSKIFDNKNYVPLYPDQKNPCPIITSEIDILFKS